MTTNSTRAILAALFATSTVLLTACGGGGGNDPVGTSPPATQEPSTPVAVNAATVTVNGVERSYVEYAPAKVADLREYDARGVRVVIALHDDGSDGNAYAQRTRWTELADEHGFVVAFPNAAQSKWNLTGDANAGDELAYVNAVAAAMRTKYALVATIPTYLTGTGTGGALAQQLAMRAPNLAAAVASINGVAPAPTFNRTDLPPSAMGAWIIRSADTPLTTTETLQAAYWQKANETDQAPKVQATDLATDTTYANQANPLQQVRISSLKPGVTADGRAVTRMIWNSMFDGVVRFADDTRVNGTLHANQTIASMKLVEAVKELRPGSTRRWLTYVPSNYEALKASGKKVPLLFSYHGRNGSARFQALITEWPKVAEEKGFIVVFPQGIGATWAVPMEADARDMLFFQDLYAEVTKTYNIDTTRVYLNGSSMGTAMSNRIAVQQPNLFAALALCYSGHLGAASYANPIVRTDIAMPVWQCRGGDELDSEFPGSEPAAREFWRSTVNKHKGPPVNIVDGRRKIEVWSDGLAEYRWQVTDKIGHFWHPGQARLMWEQMLSKYSRAPNGALQRQD
ncbi:PHB depolymerase family esterase [Pigmentiphaga litoralis]|uniref:Poly(3-hydroxybutyrate) depolymerase n=1 Tax=Pigmentiphaga litoralis TaxID=516702 RepID=A0A7Y9IR89_9BURK|nr:PHB depolymerase family esterase [Pigmentiphaga litoralis]NYE25304.1 poly(3-hydroxybutyrate) depolymerase [Pigmentiphaga litoralis]NYE81083.1 poly(3-hydroxybutyrate) depolymerase [Pigmentiphaga litoralis]